MDRWTDGASVLKGEVWNATTPNYRSKPGGGGGLGPKMTRGWGQVAGGGGRSWFGLVWFGCSARFWQHGPPLP